MRKENSFLTKIVWRAMKVLLALVLALVVVVVIGYGWARMSTDTSLAARGIVWGGSKYDDWKRFPNRVVHASEDPVYFGIEETDIFIANSCSVRQKSEDKVYGLGQYFKMLNDSGKEKPFVILAGCMVGSASGDRVRFKMPLLKRKTPWVNEYISPDEINKKVQPIFREASKIRVNDYVLEYIDQEGIKSNSYSNQTLTPGPGSPTLFSESPQFPLF